MNFLKKAKEWDILIAIELLAILICIISGGLWLYNPSGPYEPTFAVAGLALVVIEIYRRIKSKRFKKGHVLLDIDISNTSFCYYFADGSKKMVISP